MENWKTVVGFPIYEVSDRGRVRRKAYTDKNGRFWPRRLRKTHFTEINGFCLALHIGKSKYKQAKVSRLMLKAFVRMPFHGEEARHLNDNRRQNILTNLAWGSRQDNVDDMFRNGRFVVGSRHHNSMLTERTVLKIRSLYKFNSRTNGITALGKRFGVRPATIWRVVRGGGWAHV